MASSRMRSDRSEGESSSASQANSGLVIAIRMRASESKRRNGRYPYTATTPRLVRRLVEKTEKNSAQPILPRIDVFLGGTVFGRLDSDRKKWERRTPQRAGIRSLRVVIASDLCYRKSTAAPCFERSRNWTTDRPHARTFPYVSQATPTHSERIRLRARYPERGSH